MAHHSRRRRGEPGGIHFRPGGKGWGSRERDVPGAGYGPDYDERYRNLPHIGVLKPEVYGG